MNWLHNALVYTFLFAVACEEKPAEESEEESEEIEVRRFKYKGKEYLKDVNDNTLYTADGDIIGIYNENTDSID